MRDPMMSPCHSCDDGLVSDVDGNRCSDSELRGRVMACLTSAFTGCPIGFAAPTPGQGVGAWRLVSRYRSGTVAGSHGLPCFPRRSRREIRSHLEFKELERQ